MFLLDQEPELDRRLKGEVCEAVMDRSLTAIGQYSGRDRDFTTADMQAERDPWWAGIRPRWKGGCFIEDPLTDEHLFEFVANMMYVQQQNEWYEATEVEEADAQIASNLEAFMNDVVIEAKINTVHAYDLLCNAARHSYGVLYCGWKQEFRTDRRTVARHKRSNRLVQPEDQEVLKSPEDYELTEIEVPTVAHDGLDCRVPYTGDVYFDSPAAQSFKQAARVIERFEYTEDDLLNGIEDYGFDREQVKLILASGPSSSARTYFSQYNEREGISGQDTYEVLMVTGTLPALLEDGMTRLKSDVRRRDYTWMLCPAARSVFKFSKSPYQRRPYVKFPFRGVPGRMIGHSVCNMLAPLQREASLAYRFRVDFRDVYMSSPIIVPAALYNDWASFRAYPGAAYPVELPYTPDHFKPLPYNPAGYQAGIADWKDTISRADAYFSADARSPVQYGNRTATEMAQISSGADEKTDLVLTNWHMGVEDLGEIILSHYAQFASGEMARRVNGKTITIEPEMLRKNIRIAAVGTSENANPLMRVKKALEVAEYARQDPIAIEKYQRGDKTPAFYVNDHVYRALGVRGGAQAIDGPEPTAPPNADYILESIVQLAQQYAQAGDPAALQILQVYQQAMQQQQEQGAEGGGGQQPQRPPFSANFKDFAPNQKDVAAQMMGLPPAQQPQPMGPQGPPQMNGSAQGAGSFAGR